MDWNDTQLARAVTDNYPRIEYAPWVHPKEITRTLPNLLALSTEPPITGGDETLHMEIARQRATLQDFYAAGL
jgi:spermidine synthase